jgi:hypothetical protein
MRMKSMYVFPLTSSQLYKRRIRKRLVFFTLSLLIEPAIETWLFSVQGFNNYLPGFPYCQKWLSDS